MVVPDPEDLIASFPRRTSSGASLDELVAAAIVRLTALGLPRVETIALSSWRRNRPGWHLCAVPGGSRQVSLLVDGTLVAAGRKVRVHALDPATKQRVVDALEYVVLWGRAPRDRAPR